nr:interferon alpha-inducible protein 27, mitochondrial-like [Danio rerio]|eukprot:XP_009305786.1 interferon alpha-inducible protein 27, mitochondrial-like [Danio rerio]
MGLVTILAGAGAVAVGLFAAAPAAVSAMGFTAGGISAGSFASWMMSVTAKANGGGVAAGSLVSLLQAIGAAGLSAAAKIVFGAKGAL